MSCLLPAQCPQGATRAETSRTFRTYLRKELGPHAGFLGLVSEGTIAFVCTTQSEGVPAKVAKDIAKIRASGHPVHEIRAFSLASVPVAARHKLESDMQQQHAIRLEFFDAEAITELLATPEGFWIAEQFLALPADVRPSQQLDDEDLSAWYLELRSRWREKRTPDPTFGDLIDMKAGLREATFRREARADLPFWLGLIREMLADPALPVPARQRARYELVVATLRGLGDLRPVDEVARAYLNDSLTESEPARIEDASVLLMYAKGAALRGLTTIGASELSDWHAGPSRRVEHRMVGAAPHRRAGLLFTLGHLGIHPALTEEELPYTTKDLPDMVDWDRNVPSITIPDGMMLPDAAFVDVRLAMSALRNWPAKISVLRRRALRYSSSRDPTPCRAPARRSRHSRATMVGSGRYGWRLRRHHPESPQTRATSIWSFFRRSHTSFLRCRFFRKPNSWRSSRVRFSAGWRASWRSHALMTNWQRWSRMSTTQRWNATA